MSVNQLTTTAIDGDLLTLWQEMCIREARTQAHFAILAEHNIYRKANPALGEGPTDVTFSSIHSFLSHIAMVGKMLKPERSERYTGGDDSLLPMNLIGISHDSQIFKRRFRDRLEHFDNKFDEWLRKHFEGHTIATYNIMPKSSLKTGNIVYISNFDSQTSTYTLLDEDLDLSQLKKEVQQILSAADKWLQELATEKEITP